MACKDLRLVFRLATKDIVLCGDAARYGRRENTTRPPTPIDVRGASDFTSALYTLVYYFTYLLITLIAV